MLVTPTISRKRTAEATVIEPSAEPLSSPPVITPVRVHPVYGNSPIGRDGFTLDRQLTIMLNFWHKKAVEIGATNGADADEARTIASEIYEAAIVYRCACGRDFAYVLQIIARQMQADDTVTVIGLEEFAGLAERAMLATAPPEPQKRVPALSKGRKLTRAGVLYRYHAYLLGELNTVGHELYGNADYAKISKAEEDIVSERLGKITQVDKPYPCFRASDLLARATAVLKTLNINSTRVM